MLEPLLEGEMFKRCTALRRDGLAMNMLKEFLSVEMLKSARHCGTKQISKSKCERHHVLGPLLDVEMLKRCTRLRRHMFGSLFDVQS